jgi:hypothetical protein
MLAWLRWLVIAGLAALIAGAALVSCGGGGYGYGSSSGCVGGTYNSYGQIVGSNCTTPAAPGPFVVSLGICPGSPVPTPTPAPFGVTPVPTPMLSPCPLPSPMAVATDCALQFHAIGQFNNGLVFDITTGSTWSSTDQSVVEQATGPNAIPGQFFSNTADGTASINAVAGNIVASPIPITVQAGAACPTPYPTPTPTPTPTP